MGALLLYAAWLVLLVVLAMRQVRRARYPIRPRLVAAPMEETPAELEAWTAALAAAGAEPCGDFAVATPSLDVAALVRESGREQRVRLWLLRDRTVLACASLVRAVGPPAGLVRPFEGSLLLLSFAGDGRRVVTANGGRVGLSQLPQLGGRSYPWSTSPANITAPATRRRPSGRRAGW